MSLNPTRPVVRLAFILLPLLKLITTWKRIEIWSGKGRGSILIKAYMEWSVSRGDFLKPIDTAKLVAAVIIYNWRYYNIICSGTTKQGGGGGGRRGGGGGRRGGGRGRGKERRGEGRGERGEGGGEDSEKQSEQWYLGCYVVVVTYEFMHEHEQINPLIYYIDTKG